jgi:hypothetical protein
MQQMSSALKNGGVLIFQTFIEAHEKPEQGSMNPAYLLKINELLDVFAKDLQVIYYEEFEGVNLRGERNKTASLVAKKR